MENSRYGHYNELVETSAAFLKGKITIGLLEETVNRILSCIRDGKQQFKSIEWSPELKSELKEELSKTEEGFSLFEEGIEKIRLFFEDKSKMTLWQGLSLAKLGCDLLNDISKKHSNPPKNETP